MSKLKFRFGGKKEEKEKIPYHVDTIINAGNNRVSVIVVKITNGYKTIIEIINEISKYGKPIIKMGTPSYTDKTVYAYFAIGDCGRECGRELKNIIQSIEGVGETYLYESENGYVFIPFDELKFVDEESAVFTLKMLASMVYKVVLPSSGSSIIRGYPLGLGSMSFLATMGSAAGRIIYEYLTRYVREELFEDFDEYVETMLVLFSKFLKSIGEGDVEITEESGRRYRVVMKNGALECRGLRKYNFTVKTGYLTRGLIEGFFEELFDRRVSVKESKCINKADGRCEYIVEIMESR